MWEEGIISLSATQPVRGTEVEYELPIKQWLGGAKPAETPKEPEQLDTPPTE